MLWGGLCFLVVWGGVLVRGCLCTGTCTGTTWGVARRGYREGDVQVTVWLTRVQRGQLRALGGSAQETVVRLIGEAFGEVCGEGPVGGAVDVQVASDGSGSRPVGGGDSEGAAGISGPVGGEPGLTGADRLSALLESKNPPAAAAEPPTVGDTNNTNDPIDMIA